MDVNINNLNPANPEHLQQLHIIQQQLADRALELDRIQQELSGREQQLNAMEHQENIVSPPVSPPPPQDLPPLPPSPPPTELSEVLDKLSNQLSINSVNVQPYKGDPQGLEPWFKAVEKQVLLTHKTLVPSEMVRLAYAMSAKTVSDFLGRYIKDHGHKPWSMGQWLSLQQELRDRFGEQIDPMTKMTELKRFKQRKNQGAQVFAEILLGKADSIFSPAEMQNWYVQRELVSIFIRGLLSTSVAKKVSNKNPASLEAAVAYCNDAVASEARLEAHGLQGQSHSYNRENVRQEEPMDISYLQSKGKSNGRARMPNQWLDGKPVCNFCRAVGHVYKSCPKRLAQGKSYQNKSMYKHRYSQKN